MVSRTALWRGMLLTAMSLGLVVATVPAAVPQPDAASQVWSDPVGDQDYGDSFATVGREYRDNYDLVAGYVEETSQTLRLTVETADLKGTNLPCREGLLTNPSDCRSGHGYDWPLRIVTDSGRSCVRVEVRFELHRPHSVRTCGGQHVAWIDVVFDFERHQVTAVVPWDVIGDPPAGTVLNHGVGCGIRSTASLLPEERCDDTIDRAHSTRTVLERPAG